MACSGRAFMANHVRPIAVSPAERAELERLQRAPSTPAGLSRRARAVLLMAQGVSGVEIAERIGYTVVQVSRIRRRYADDGVAGLHDRPKSGRPPTVSARKRAQIVALTLRPPGRGVTHWTTRDMARTAGVSHSTVHRIWQGHALQPHRVTTFKFTTDPEAEAKIHDVVGLYLQPPTNAVVVSVDEKTQIQALSRTQPLLPLRPRLSGAGAARHSRQLLHAHDTGRARVAGGTPPRAFSLHPDRGLMAEHGRSVVQHPDPQVGPPGVVRYRARPYPPHRALPRRVECAPDPLCVDQRTRRHHSQSSPACSLT